MKAITLWQPWASAVVLGIKCHETRSWPAPEALVGQRVAIHAAKRSVDTLPVKPNVQMGVEFEAAMSRLGRSTSYARLPFGAVLGEVTLAYCRQVDALERVKGVECARMGGTMLATTAWGDYSTGRWVWGLLDPVEYDDPIVARGGQRVWNWDEAEVPA